MSRCRFCGREFENSQGVKAHLRWCPKYSKSNRGTAGIGRSGSPLSRPKPHQGSPPRNGGLQSIIPVSRHPDQIPYLFPGVDEAALLKQKREALLTGLSVTLVDCHYPPEGIVTPEMAAAAKVAILDELGSLAIEDMLQAELMLRATTVRDRIFAPYFRQQQKQAGREREKREQDTARSRQEAATQARRLKRKVMLVELGVSRALKPASSQGLRGLALTLLEREVRARLETLRAGDETEPQVEETIEAAIERPLLEWSARVEQAQKAKRERILGQCLELAAPVAVAALPWVKEVVVKKVCEKFGFRTPPPSPAPDASASPEDEKAPPHSETTASRPIRRRRRSAVPEDATRAEIIAQTDPDASVPPADGTAAS